MAISIFPSTAAEFVSNNFVVDMNDTSNNTANTGGVKEAGPYSISFSSGDSSFDVYLIDLDGNLVGYSNNTSIVASGLFSTVVILGVSQDEIISFTYQGSVNNADGEGNEPGAGAYLESISPSDLPTIDDTATVTGGNFASDVEITFESGATVLSAKNIVRNSSTELVVTRPDSLIEDEAPYNLKAVNPGVSPPTGSNAHILADSVTAGSDPTWVTGGDLTAAFINQAYTETLEATDADGTVVDYSVTAGALPTGLSLNTSTGVISGTPTASGQTFTVTATDDGGNTTPKEFTLPVAIAEGGTITSSGQFVYHTFTSTDDLIVNTEISNADLFVLAGGGAGGGSDNVGDGGGGGGAGGLLETNATLSVGTITCTVGAGGLSTGSNGSNSSVGGLATATGGGAGANPLGSQIGSDGGSGGGGGNGVGGSGTAGQGNDGGNSTSDRSGGGGGGAISAGEDGSSDNPGDGGTGLQTLEIATQSGIDVDGGFFAGGGGGGSRKSGDISSGGLGGGGDAGDGLAGQNGTPNTGGGGGGASAGNPAGLGGSGLIVVRYAI